MEPSSSGRRCSVLQRVSQPPSQQRFRYVPNRMIYRLRHRIVDITLAIVFILERQQTSAETEKNFLVPVERLCHLVQPAANAMGKNSKLLIRNLGQGPPAIYRQERSTSFSSDQALQGLAPANSRPCAVSSQCAHARMP